MDELGDESESMTQPEPTAEQPSRAVMGFRVIVLV
jgi:hypothetical protein